MTPLAVLLAATILAGVPAPQHAARPNVAAQEHAAQQQQKSMEQAVHRQLEYEQHVIREQQRSIHEQMKAQLQAQAQAHAASPSGFVAPRTTGFAGRPYGSVVRPYYGGHHHSYYYHRGNSHHNYRHHTTWPMAADPELVGLQHLRRALDGVHKGHPATPTQKQGIERGLMQVVEVSRPPSVASMGRLAGHLGTALADRQLPHIDTQSLALELRAGVNSPNLIAAERVQVWNRLQATLKAAEVGPAAVSSVLEALKTVEHQEQARR